MLNVLSHCLSLGNCSAVVNWGRHNYSLLLLMKLKRKKLEFSHTRYRALGPELIPVYKQSACRWLFKSSPVVGCHYFPPGLLSPFRLKNVIVLRPVASYTAWWYRHIGVNNLLKVASQLCSGGNWTHHLLIVLPLCHVGVIEQVFMLCLLLTSCTSVSYTHLTLPMKRIV